MKPQELRIGNLVYYKSRVINVTMIGEFGIQSKTRLETINAKFITPDITGIPLTEEWLLRFGFEKNKVKLDLVDWTDYRKGNMVLNYTTFEVTGYQVEYGSEIFDIEERTHICAIQYVHQLQNLYFALTGKELTINA